MSVLQARSIIIKGKGTSQTIQDAGLFAVSKYFGFCSALSREQVAASVQRLKQESLVREKRKAALTPSPKRRSGTCRLFALYPWPRHFTAAIIRRQPK
ncbi:hypothetical protein PO124_16365 [Bacillus licheniformis]|nr:hypothetical protein [Bacillus licheniformis]